MLKIGILGSGQLARMLVLHGFHRLGFRDIHIYGPSGEAIEDLPEVTFVRGRMDDAEAIEAFIQSCDRVTWEREDIAIQNGSWSSTVVPSLQTLAVVQNKALQKEIFHETVDCGEWHLFSSVAAVDCWAHPCVVKLATGGFDGRAVWIVKDEFDLSVIPRNQPIIVEQFYPRILEYSVIVAKDGNRNMVWWDPVEMHMSPKTNQLRYYMNAHTDHHSQCIEFAKRVVDSLPGPGLFAVEMFYLVQEDRLILNEVAARVHNSGHHTIDTHDLSQFEMMARLVIGIPLQQPKQLCERFATWNIVGNSNSPETAHYISCPSGIPPPFLHIHDYHKLYPRMDRKMGHATIIDHDMRSWDGRIKLIPTDCAPIIGVIMGSKSDEKVMDEATDLLDRAGIPYEVTVVSAHRTPQRLVEYASTAASRGIKVIIAGAGGAAHLPGMVASETLLPVIGVPVKTSTLNGVDSLYSIVQMPRGVPVACMAINGAKNAAIFALRILGETDALESIRAEMLKSVYSGL